MSCSNPSITKHILDLTKGKNKFDVKMAVVNRKTGPVYANGLKHEKLNEEKNRRAFTATSDQ